MKTKNWFLGLVIVGIILLFMACGHGGTSVDSSDDGTLGDDGSAVTAGDDEGAGVEDGAGEDDDGDEADVEDGTLNSLTEQDTDGDGIDDVLPTVESLTDSSDNVLASTGSSVALDGSLGLTFSESIDATTLSSDTVSVTCNGVAVEVAIAEAVDTDTVADNEFALTSDAWPNNNCTVTLLGGSEGVTDSSGLALAENVSWNLAPSCGFDENFIDAAVLTNGCWTAANGNNYATTLDSNTTNASMLTMVLDASDSDDNPPYISKTLAGDFAATVFVSNLSADQAKEKVFANVSANQETVTDKMELRFGKGSLANKFTTSLALATGAGAESGSLGTSAGNAVYFCFIRSGNAVTSKFSYNGTVFTDVAGSATMSDNLATLRVGALNDATSGGNGLSTQIDWVAIEEGGTSCPAL